MSGYKQKQLTEYTSTASQKEMTTPNKKRTSDALSLVDLEKLPKRANTESEIGMVTESGSDTSGLEELMNKSLNGEINE